MGWSASQRRPASTLTILLSSIDAKLLLLLRVHGGIMRAGLSDLCWSIDKLSLVKWDIPQR